MKVLKVSNAKRSWVKGARASDELSEAAERALEALHHIETIAGLLETAGSRHQAEPLEARLVASAAFLISEHNARVRDQLMTLSAAVIAGERSRSVA